MGMVHAAPRTVDSENQKLSSSLTKRVNCGLAQICGSICCSHLQECGIDKDGKDFCED
ncbi:unnamed protein product [Cunninghamella echinulata]